MSSTTEKLNLFKYDVEKDAKETFSIVKSLNNNWDKIDEFAKQAQFVPFCFNSGVVDANGNAACLTVENNVLKLLSGSVGTTAGGMTYTVQQDVTSDISSFSAGKYNLFYDVENQSIGKYASVIAQPKQPENLSVEDIWLDNSKMPWTSKMKNSTGEIVVREIIPLPVELVVVASSAGSILLMPIGYNNNRICNTKYLNETQITNCLLEVPEHIKISKIENSNNIQMVAGSKFYLPNGTTYTVSNTGMINNTTSGNALLFFNYTAHTYGITSRNACYYSSTEPTSPSNLSFWWNSTTNEIHRYVNGAWSSDIWTLPLVLFDANNEPHALNTAGIFANVMFFLPGLKYLACNGRNADGTLNNIEYTTTKILQSVYTYVTDTGSQGIVLYGGNNLYRFSNFFNQIEEPSTINSILWLNPETNILKMGLNGAWNVLQGAIVVDKVYTNSSYAITNYNPRYPLKLVTSDELEELKNNIENLALTNVVKYPGTTAITLTATNNQKYTAPSNGIYAFTGSGGSLANCYLLNITKANLKSPLSRVATSGGECSTLILAEKGDEVQLHFDCGNPVLRFIASK